MKNKRLSNVSFVRVISFAMVFAFHCFFFGTSVNSRGVFPFSAAVQSFLFLSGFLYSQKDALRKGFLKDEFRKITDPSLFYLIALAVFDLGWLAFSGKPVSFEAVKYAIGSDKPNGYATQFGNLWYIPALLACYLFLPLMQKARKGGWFAELAVFAVIAELVACWYLGEPIVAMPFLFGYWYGGKAFADETDPSIRKGWAFYVMPALALAGLCWLYVLAKDLRGFDTMLQGPIGVLLAIVPLRLLRFTNAKQESPLLGYAGKLTFWLYIIHETFMCGPTDLMAGRPIASGIAFAFVASLVSAVVLMEAYSRLKNLAKREAFDAYCLSAR
jgi:peptidoglycan/LPS O-acetylase OafA/YrhL